MFSHWKIQDFNPGEGEKAGAAAPRYDDRNWLAAAVPGDVHSTLRDAGRIPDPFYGRNERACRWVEGREWWYRTSFAPGQLDLGPEERFLLVFEGLDTLATVWLNGALLGRHSNMFRAAVFDASRLVRPDEANTLAVRFDPASKGFAGRKRPGWSAFHPGRVHLRKAQFGWGWDWGPRLPTVGIWRPVKLLRQRWACIQGAHFSTLEINPAARQARVRVRVEVERFSPGGDLAIEIRLCPMPVQGEAAGQAFEIQTSLNTGDPTDPSLFTAAVEFNVDQPRLWWTHDLGEPTLYDLEVRLLHEGAEIDRHQDAVGIRTVQLDQSPDLEEPGTRFFRFVLNDISIFARGADWIPADSFVGAIPEGRYDQLIEAAQDANMNMLRVWGGGIYEHDCFYDLCDRRGLLVWQDFMFACAAYPESPPDFVEEVRAEAEYQVRRLRSHPCLALWCGNNENQWIHDKYHWYRPNHRVPGALYYDHILPEMVARWDGATPYWPGSPSGGNDHNSPEEGDAHNWQVWHGLLPRRFGQLPWLNGSPRGVAFTHYAEDLSRFVSEFGMHASPVLETLRRAVPPEQLFHHSPAIDYHNKDHPKNKGDRLMRTVTGLPKNLQESIDFSMIAQAEGLKFGIEHYRRRKPHCSGTLFWQLNDCWPALSWSAIDYYGFPKAGYYYARRAYAPVLASFKSLPGGELELWITNDRLEDLYEQVTVSNRTFEGETQWQQTMEARLTANSSRPVCRWSAGELAAGPDRYLWVRSEQGSFLSNRHFFTAIQSLKRPKPEVVMSLTHLDEHRILARFKTDCYAYFVHLSTPKERVQYSENYFDLEPGSERVIEIDHPSAEHQVVQVQHHWR